MDLHGTDDWIFEDLLEAKKDNTEEKNENSVKLDASRKSVNESDELASLRQTVRAYEYRQQKSDVERQRFVQNFHRLLVTARAQINKLQTVNSNLSERLNSYMSVKCPKCSHHFRCNNSRVLPKYVRYVKSCHRLELEFTNDEQLRSWLLISNLDTDAQGLPVIQENKLLANSLKAVGSHLVGAGRNGSSTMSQTVKECRPTRVTSVQQTQCCLDVENLPSNITIRELKNMFSEVARIADIKFHENQCNKAVVYFYYRNHLKRVMDKFQNKTVHGRRIRLVERFVKQADGCKAR